MIRPSTVMWLLLMVALLGGTRTYAVNLDTKSLKVQPTRAVATTQAAAKRQGAFNINGVNWNCSGAQCSAPTSPVSGVSPVTMCQGLAREVGEIQSFSIANHALNGAEVKQCNSVAQAASTTPSLKTPPGFSPAPGAKPDMQAKKPIGIPPPTPDAKPNMPPGVAKPGKGFLPDTAAPKAVVVTPPTRNINTAALVMTGNRFAPRTVTTAGLTMTGLRFPGISIRTSELEMTGNRFRPTEINTRSLEMTGTRPEERLLLTRLGKAPRFEPVTIGTDTLRMTGQRFHPVTIGTSSLTFTGNR